MACCLQLTDWRNSLEDASPRIPKDAILQHKVNAANCLGNVETQKAPEVQLRRLSSPSPATHMQPLPLPLPPHYGTKTMGRRPVCGGGGAIPPSVLQELSMVLNKTGRRSDD